MTLIPDDIPGNPEVWGLTMFNGKIICATSEGVYVAEEDGGWSLLEAQPSGSGEVFVEIDYFGSVKVCQKPTP